MKISLSDRSNAPVSLSRHLAEQVLALIQDEALAAGDRLPSVRELSERFSVATPTMREALRLLQMAGNLDIRHGSGIYVRQPESRLMLTNPYAGSLEHRDDPQSPPRAPAHRAAGRRSWRPPMPAPSISTALTSCSPMPSTTSPGRTPTTPCSASPTCASTAASPTARGNTILAEVVFTLTEVHIKEQMAVLDLYNNRRRDHEQHKLILEALRARDAAGAQRLMREHIADVISVIRRSSQGGQSTAA